MPRGDLVSLVSKLQKRLQTKDAKLEGFVAVRYHATHFLPDCAEANLKIKQLSEQRSMDYATQPKEKIIDDLRARIRTLETALGTAALACVL